MAAARRAGVTLAALLIGTFVGTLNNSVANVAVPSIMADLGVPLSSAVWVVSAYVLTFAVLMPGWGYLGDLYGQRRTYLWGMGLFTLACLGGGLAPSFSGLLAARVLQGIGIAPTLPAVMAIVARIFPPGQRGRALGFWALANGAGHALGPPLSGWLTQQLTWRAAFLVSLPFCLLTLGLAWRLLPPDGRRQQRAFDLPGAAALTVAALGLMLALTQGARWGWASPLALGLWALTLAALALFRRAERRASSPFVEPALFPNRRYLAAVAVIAAQYFCLFGLQLAVPVLLIQALGWGERDAGLVILPLPLVAALLAPWAGRLADARGSRWACTRGLALIAVAGSGLWALAAARGAGMPWWGLGAGLVAMGAGMGLTQAPVVAAVTHLVRPEQMGVATGLFHMGRFLSGSLGATLFGLALQMHAGGMVAGFRRDLLLVALAAGLAVLAARRLPGQAETANLVRS